MTLTPEEALREFQKWTFFTGDTGEPTTYLASLGYRLTPIEINEAAVKTANDVYWSMDENDDVRMRAAIVAYLEGVK